eukprot:CAMPEP_0183442520 /NCGR_PEP_ID=MMETSP0370-20130417/88574_1 /TAXON_ID=268820 /ORGANISM="Peridinium aciculiferum, Strain PAER-2" /LENGTH=66 /DNA_ID=CAMNT_0025632175 /DNA_START=61 /DNA_END=257 /DNA_ORIENTATION=-
MHEDAYDAFELSAPGRTSLHTAQTEENLRVAYATQLASLRPATKVRAESCKVPSSLNMRRLVLDLP